MINCDTSLITSDKCLYFNTMRYHLEIPFRDSVLKYLFCIVGLIYKKNILPSLDFLLSVFAFDTGFSLSTH